MFGMPMFDLKDAVRIVAEIEECRRAFPNHYVKVNAFDSTRGIESLRLSFIVGRPAREPGFSLVREEGSGRRVRYTTRAYATDQPEGERY
jgi:ribulose-bisphosphate carboxylase small chain